MHSEDINSEYKWQEHPVMNVDILLLMVTENYMKRNISTEDTNWQIFITAIIMEQTTKT